MAKITGIPVIWLMLLLGIGAAIAQPPMPNFSSQQIKANSIVNRIRSDRATTYKNFKDAQSNKDLLKSICVYDKLKQLDVLISSAEDRLMIFNQALQTNNSMLVEHELEILNLLDSRCTQFVQEADQCLGIKSLLITDKSSVTSQVSGYLPESTIDYPLSNLIIEPPSCSSCYK